MKLKRIAGSLLAVVLAAVSINVGFAYESDNNSEAMHDYEVSDFAESSSAVDTVFESDEVVSLCDSTVISVGEYIIMGNYLGEDILWRCVDIDENGPLILSDKILCIKPFDAAGTDTSGSHGRGYYYNDTQGYYRQTKGSNYWGDSNIRDWLNSEASAGEVVWSCGNPPNSDNVASGDNDYADEAGFLSNFTSVEKQAVKTVTQKQLLDGYEYSVGSENTIDDNHHILNNNITDIVQNYDTALSEDVTDKMFLLDVKQLYAVYNNLGEYYMAVCTPAAVADNEYESSESHISTTGYGYYWLRTPATDSSIGYNRGCFVREVSPFGIINYDTAFDVPAYYGADGVRPAFYLDEENAVFISGDGTEDSPYILDSSTSSDDSEETSNETESETESESTSVTNETATETTTEDNIIASGTCGNKSTWTLDSSGTLTISGTGTMVNYSKASSVPWYSYADSIETVCIEDGITNVGAYAFYGCTNLTSIIISESVTSIGNYAFYNCNSLTSINIPESVISIGTRAFYGCTSLTEFNISENTDINYTVKFSANGGSSVDDITAQIGSTIELPATERDGYAFKGWYTDSSDENEFTAESLVLYDITLYAKWVKIVTVTFDVNGGSEVDSIEVEAGSTIELPTPEKSGCTFGGWYSDSLWSDEFTEGTEVNYNKTIYAKWIKTLPTQDEIKAKYNALNLSTMSNIYSSTPSVTAPYSAGAITDSYAQSGLDYLNFIRFVCGLQDVSIDDTLAEYSQYAAAIQAIIGGDLNHYPDQPSDMDDDFYEKAYYGSRHGNLDAGYGRNLGYGVQGFLDDDSSSSNLSTVGHRRWILNPYMLNTGFGYAENSSSDYVSYGSMYSTDMENDDPDFYDFIAYPCQGNFPEDIIDNTIPWCISLNTSLYTVESADDLNVTVTKDSTGKTWSFSQSDYKSSPTTSSKYFVYDGDAHGIDSCIIFGFGSSNITSSELDGDFTVTVTGLKDPDGNDTSFTYTTTLFSLSSSSSSSDSSGSGSSSSGSSSSGGSSGGGGGSSGGSSVSSTTYTISFNAQNGTDITSKTVVKNRTVSEPTDPTYEGYIFTGWYVDSDCTELYDFSSKVTSSFTLYAGWEIDEDYTVEEASSELTTEASEDYAANEIRVTIGSTRVLIDGNSYSMDVAPYIQTSSNSTLVPLRFVVIAIAGVDVNAADSSDMISWDASTKTASISIDDNVIEFTAGSSYMTINGVQTLMSNGVQAEIASGRMFIPFRALGEALGVDVDWEADTKTAVYKNK